MLINPIKKQVDPTAHATNPLTDGPAQGLLILVAGVVKVKCVGDSAYHTYQSGELAQGVWHPMQVSHVHTDTAATIKVGYNTYAQPTAS